MLSNKFNQYVNFIHKQTGGSSPFGIFIYVDVNKHPKNVTYITDKYTGESYDLYKEFASEGDMKTHMRNTIIKNNSDKNHDINSFDQWDGSHIYNNNRGNIYIYVKGIYRDPAKNNQYFTYIYHTLATLTANEYTSLPNMIIYNTDLPNLFNPNSTFKSPTLDQKLSIYNLQQILNDKTSTLNYFTCPITDATYIKHNNINGYIRTSASKAKAFLL